MFARCCNINKDTAPHLHTEQLVINTELPAHHPINGETANRNVNMQCGIFNKPSAFDWLSALHNMCHNAHHRSTTTKQNVC